MPIYEFQCEKCGFKIEEITSQPDISKTCLQCGGRANRVFASANFHFKGSGFFDTDYKNKEEGK